VITGKGNLVASRKHSAMVAAYLTGRTDGQNGNGRAARIRDILARVRARQRTVGYDGDYPGWMARVTPEGFA